MPVEKQQRAMETREERCSLLGHRQKKQVCLGEAIVY